MIDIPRHDEPQTYQEDFKGEYLIELQEHDDDQPNRLIDGAFTKIHIYWRNMDMDVIHDKVDLVPQDVVKKLAKDRPKEIKVCGVVIGEILRIFLDDKIDDPIDDHEELPGDHMLAG